MNIEIIALVISGFAFALSLAQFLGDNDRNKKEATLNAYYQLQEDAFAKYNDLFKKFGLEKEEVNKFELKKEDPEWETMTGILVKLEHFSVGINTGIYSLEVLNRLGGGYFIRVYDSLELVIKEHEVNGVSAGEHYNEFRKTREKLEELRKKKEKNQSVK